MCAEGAVLVADKVVPVCIESETTCEKIEGESTMCIETSPLSCEEEPESFPETFRDRTGTTQGLTSPALDIARPWSVPPDDGMVLPLG